MKPPIREEVVQSDLFLSHLENIINLNHPLMKLSGSIDWNFLEPKVSALYTLKGHPGLSVRLMSGLHLLKQMCNLSDKSVCERWEHVYLSHNKGFFNGCYEVA